MTRPVPVEVIELPTEALSYVSGSPTGPVAMLRRWRDCHLADSAGMSDKMPPSAARTGTPGSDVGLAGFRRLIDVPGGHLGVALDGWWQDDTHRDDHLRLDLPRPAGESWSLGGAFRSRRFRRWVPIELMLSPYAGPWSLLELLPRRAVRTSALYFREGHRAIDRFVAAIRVNDTVGRS